MQPVPVTLPIMGWPLRIADDGAVGDQVGGAGDRHHRAGAPGQRPGQGDVRRPGSGRSGVGGVHPAGVPVAPGQGQDLGQVAPDHGKAHLPSSPGRFGCGRSDAPAPTGSSTTGMPMALACRPEASMAGMRSAWTMPRLRVRPWQRAVISGGLRGGVRHDGGGPAGQQQVGAVVGGHVVGDAWTSGRRSRRFCKREQTWHSSF